MLQGTGEEGEGKEMSESAIQPIPPRDRHAEALAAKIIALTLAANEDIRDFYKHHDFNGASTREQFWKGDVLQACEEFNVHMARVNNYLNDKLAEILMANPTQPFVLKPMPRNE